MKTQWGGNSLTYLVHTIQHQYLHWLETAVQCCVPEAVFWAEDDFGLSVRTSHHYLVQFGVPQAADHTLRRAGKNSITQELMMHLYSPYPRGYAWYCISHMALTAMLYL